MVNIINFDFFFFFVEGFLLLHNELIIFFFFLPFWHATVMHHSELLITA